MDTISYKSAGVNIDAADEVKKQITGAVSARGLAHCTPLNRVGAFASLLELDLSGYANPVFVLKSEEPGSKQLLSIGNGRLEWIARDLINHLVNDIIVMGAKPCAVIDTIICGKLEGETVVRLIGEMSKACEENGCILVGGETSEQPGVLPDGRYVLQAGILGIVDKNKIIDGSAIRIGDVLLALASNGLHTNGYSLVRRLMEAKPAILDETIGGESFLDSILKPHTSYARAVGLLLERHYTAVHGMAHITGGGMRDNLSRILRAGGLRARIDLAAVRVPPVFSVIKKYADTHDDDMLRTFNNGAGMILVADAPRAGDIIRTLNEGGACAYPIGEIIGRDQSGCGDDSGCADEIGGSGGVEFVNSLKWA